MKRDAGRQNVEGSVGRMRAQGLRLVRLWAVDTRALRFLAECRRQSRRASRHARALEVGDEIGALHDEEGWTA